MKKTILIAIIILGSIAVTGLVSVSAARNPSGTGQPNANCEELFPPGQDLPPGFNTPGFQHATDVYAGSGANVNHTNRPDIAVSQYDVACYQQYQRITR
jgi:hypothetical protein